MIYIHKYTNQKVTIKKQHDNCIVVCELIDEPKEFNVKGYLVYQTIITVIENIAPHTGAKGF